MKKLTKSQIAKNLGISRPTLDKKIKRGEEISLPILDAERMRMCIEFSATHKNITPQDLENVLEGLQDFGFLSKEGVRFRSNYWSLFIKE